MRILVIGLNYAPDMIGTSKYTAELCEDLARRGHVVEVVTAPPYYPQWRVEPEYRRNGRRRETLDGVTVHRVPLYVPARPSGAKRLLHLMSFAVSALPQALARAAAFKPQLVFTVAPALFSAPVALLAARRARAVSWLHVQDFELDAAFGLGMLKGGLLRRFGLGFERAVLGRFDRVSTISPRMIDRLVQKGVQPAAALEIRNWVDVKAITPWPSTDTAYRRELGIPPQACVLLYSGNMGAKQGLDVLAATARVLAERRDGSILLLVGNGPYRAELAALCAGLDNVRFLDLQPAERMAELLATADIHLLPQRREAADLVLPSKLPPMLASGRAVLVMADPGTSLANEVEGAAAIASPGDFDGWMRALEGLMDAPAERDRLGLEARARAVARWDRQSILDRFEAESVALTTAPKRGQAA